MTTEIFRDAVILSRSKILFVAHQFILFIRRHFHLHVFFPFQIDNIRKKIQIQIEFTLAGWVAGWYLL